MLIENYCSLLKIYEIGCKYKLHVKILPNNLYNASNDCYELHSVDVQLYLLLIKLVKYIYIPKTIETTVNKIYLLFGYNVL